MNRPTFSTQQSSCHPSLTAGAIAACVCWLTTFACAELRRPNIVIIIDLLPTCLDVARAAYPTAYNERSIAPADGKSLVPVFRGKTRPGHDVLFWKFAHGRAVRQGDWKLVKMDKQPWELYDLAADPVELNNLAAKMPEKVQTLEKLWLDWAGPQAAKKKSKKRKTPQ